MCACISESSQLEGLYVRDLLYIIMLFSHYVVSDSFATPWTIDLEAPLSMGFPKQECWGGLPFASSGDLLDLWIEPASLALAGRFFTTEPPGKPIFLFINSVQSLSCQTLCDPMDCSTLGLPVHHQLLELTQTHVHWVSDAIQPFHPCHHLLLPSSIFPSIRVFPNELALCIRWPKYWSFSISPTNEYSGLISFRMDWLDLLAVQGISRVFSNTTVQKHQFLGAQLYSPTLTSTHDDWKNHSFD